MINLLEERKFIKVYKNTLMKMPSNTQNYFCGALNFREKEWAQIVPKWGSFFNTWLVFSRQIGQEVRWDILNNSKNNPLLLMYGEEPEDVSNDCLDRAVALFCLPDFCLDLAIKFLDVEEVISGFPEDMKIQIRSKLTKP